MMTVPNWLAWINQQRSQFIEAYRERILYWLKFFPLFLAVLALSSLVTQFGFYPTVGIRRLARYANFFVLYGFVLQGLLKLILSRHPAAFAKSRWAELSILSLIFLHLLLPAPIARLLSWFSPHLTPEAITGIYLVLTQFFVLLALLPTTLSYSKRLMALNIQPSALILLSFLFLISCGTLLLLLPRATVSGSISLIDSLFTATSAVCVTGLIVVDTATFFTPVGQAILMFLIQVGGLGIMTLTTFFAYVMGSGSRLKEYSTMQSLLGEENLGRIRQTVLHICMVTFLLEAAGAFALYGALDTSLFESKSKHIFFSVFHSISAFCNAGFTLTTENLAAGPFRLNAGMLGTIMPLIVLGGLGFPVLSNIGQSVFAWKTGKVKKGLSLHSVIVLVVSLILILSGTAAILLLENGRLLNRLSVSEKLLTSLFHSISARTAGFNTVDTASFSTAALFFLIMLMWIGASPGSTGGGVKTTTFALSVLNIVAIASGRNRVELLRKRVSDIAIIRAFSTIFLSFFYIAIALFLLLLTEEAGLESILFEVVSALSTVGLSTGITGKLTVVGKIIIIVTMFVGRVGLLAVVVALTRSRVEGKYEYTSENVLVT